MSIAFQQLMRDHLAADQEVGVQIFPGAGQMQLLHDNACDLDFLVGASGAYVPRESH